MSRFIPIFRERFRRVERNNGPYSSARGRKESQLLSARKNRRNFLLNAANDGHLFFAKDRENVMEF